MVFDLWSFIFQNRAILFILGIIVIGIIIALLDNEKSNKRQMPVKNFNYDEYKAKQGGGKHKMVKGKRHCPHCHSTNIRFSKASTGPSGGAYNPIWYCNSCHKSFYSTSIKYKDF